MPYKCSCGYTNEGPSFAAHFKYHKGDENHKKLGWLDPTSGQLLAEKPRPGRKPPDPAGPSAPSGLTPARGTTRLAPFQIDLGTEIVPLQRTEMYETYLLYNDLKARGIIKEQDISGFILDGASLLWTVGIGRPQIEGRIVKMTEVKDGRSPGDGETEAGVEHAAG